MARYGESVDRTKRVTIEPTISRCFWSAPRAYQGDKVKLFIETTKMPDGEELSVEIREVGSEVLVDEPKGPFKVKGNRCSAEYEIDWDEETLGHPLALATDRFQFSFHVISKTFGVRGQSSPLYVDLHDFSLSR